jgi:hypothetical protein
MIEVKAMQRPPRQAAARKTMMKRSTQSLSGIDVDAVVCAL